MRTTGGSGNTLIITVMVTLLLLSCTLMLTVLLPVLQFAALTTDQIVWNLALQSELGIEFSNISSELTTLYIFSEIFLISWTE